MSTSAPVELFLIRHAAAVDIAPSDADRQLSARGRERFEATVRGLDALGIRFGRMLHSPLLRAFQTAELCGPLCEGALEECDELAARPGEGLLERVRRVDAECVALIGHEPWMSDLLGLLTMGSDVASANFPFKKGGVARLQGEVRPQGMLLRAFLPPPVTRRLGGADS